MTECAGEQKKGHGCCFYGCITMLVLSVLLVVGAIVSVRMVVKWLTSTEAVALPTVDYPAEALQELEQRVQAFNTAVSDNKPTPPLVLSAEEINALISKGENLKDLKGRLYVTIEDNQLRGQFSAPLALMAPEFKLGKGRFANGSAVFDVVTQGGVLVLRLTDFELGGKRLPTPFMADLKKKNLLEKFYEDVEKMKTIQKLKSVEIRDGKLVFEGAAGG